MVFRSVFVIIRVKKSCCLSWPRALGSRATLEPPQFNLKLSELSPLETSMVTSSPAAVLVNFTKYSLETHVEKSLQKAWGLSRGQPLNASHLLKGALLVVQKNQSKAFLKLASLLPLSNLTDVKATGQPADLAALPMTKPLADSFSVAEGFFKDKGAVWGRDYVTLALLAKDDPSLAQTASEAGSSVQAIWAAWFDFVSKGRTRRPREAWQRWWRGAGVPLPAVEKSPTAAAYLFTWNPRKSTFAKLDDHIAEIETQGFSVFPWGTGNRRNIKPDERVFLLRQGLEPRGLIGVGKVQGTVREVSPSDPGTREERGKSLEVDVRWRALSREPFVALPRLEQAGSKDIWAAQASGTELPPDVIQQLEDIWPHAWEEYRRNVKAPPEIQPREWIATFDADLGGKDDSLSLERYVRAFARVMASRTLTPPLSIGLFGDWGSGKSFFMERLYNEIRELSNPSRADVDLYWQRICQIRFNAWHYTETNLWASLVSTIFNELRSFLDGPKDDADEFNKLLNQLELAGELREAAQKRVKEAADRHQKARENVADAEKELHDLPVPPELPDKAVRAILAKNITELAQGTDSKKIAELLDRAAEWSGRDDFKEGAERLRSGKCTVQAAAGLLEEARAFSSQAGFWWRVLSAAKIYKTRGFWILAAALVAIPLLFRFVYPQLGRGSADLWTLLGETLTIAAAVIGWVRSGLRDATSVFDRLSSLKSNVARSIDEARNEDRRTYERERGKALQKEKEARARLEKAISEEQQAAEEERKASEALRHSTSQARLGRFIRERAGGADYEKHLGLIAMIHRDFKRLSELMAEARKDEANPTLPRVDRIILYIDDLDRCYPPEKVVKILEAVHLLLFFPLFVVVVGVDSRWVSRSLHKHFEGMLADEAISIDKDSGKIERPPAESQDFLEKIFQVPFWLRRMEPIAVRRLIHSLISSAEFEASPAILSPVVGGDAAVDLTAPDSAEDTAADTHPATPAEDPTRADAKRTTAEAETARLVEDQPLPPTIESLTITESELLFMDKVAPLMPRTPRAVKRFVNIYRLYKAALAPEGLASFLGKPSQPGNFRAVQVLLALVTGTPRLAQRVFRELQENDGGASRRLSDLVNISDAEETWKTTLESLEEFAVGDNNLALAALREVSPLVARYSVHHMVSPEPGESGLG
jgi:hypothetical protein